MLPVLTAFVLNHYYWFNRLTGASEGLNPHKLTKEPASSQQKTSFLLLPLAERNYLHRFPLIFHFRRVRGMRDCVNIAALIKR